MRVNAVQNQSIVGTPQINTVENNTEDFSKHLKTTASLEQIFDEASDKHGVNKNLLKAIAKAESNFRPDATSRSGAQGIMQLMPRTAAYLGVDDPYDPYQNIMGGAKYIKEMLDMYNGDEKLALAAYNAGCNNVNKYGGIPPFKETQNYVVKVMGYMNEGVQLPDATYNRTTSTSTNQNFDNVRVAEVLEKDDSQSKILDQLFSYDDYLRFLDLYLKVQQLQQTKEAEKEKDDSDNKDQNDSFYSYQEIKLNPAVTNLLNGTRI